MNPTLALAWQEAEIEQIRSLEPLHEYNLEINEERKQTHQYKYFCNFV